MTSATNISTELEASIKSDVKASLRMQRKPRNLKLFWYFLHCYKKSIQPPTSTTIGISLTLRAPDTVIIQKNLGITGAEDYEPWFSTFCEWRFGGAYSYTRGQQRQLKRWTPAAHDLFSKWSHLEIPHNVERLFYRETRDITPSLISTIGISLTRPFYHNTASSPNRWYHPLQSLTTEQKKAAFRGCVNVDIVSCYTSIWWNEMGGKDCTLENAWLLHPDHKEEFYNLLVTTFNLRGRDEAKEMRQRLTADYKNGHFIPSGSEWFDALHIRILEDAYAWAANVCLVKPTAHKIFTYLEWKIIERMLEAGDEVLLMHDGIIFKEVDVPRLRKAALPHKLKIERW